MSNFVDTALGIMVEAALLSLFVITFYRLLSGRFLVPKREIVLPYQRGVIVEGTRTVRVVEPGSCWVRPKQKVVLCDIRPRPLQLIGIEAVASDGGIVRLSVGGEYYVSDPATFTDVSREAANTFVAAIRRSIIDAVREQTSNAVVAYPERLASRVQELVASEGKRLGMDFVRLEIWELLQTGWLQAPTRQASPSIVH